MNDLIRPGTKNLIRDINNSRVLQIIQARAPVSRAEIAKITQLPPATVTSIVGDFIRAGLVRETDLVRESPDGMSALGRPPIMLTLNEQAGFAAGVKLRPDGMTVTITDLAGTSIYHVDRPLSGRGPQQALSQVASEVRAALAQAQIESTRVLGLGIGMPGLIDHVRGVCRYSSLLGWTDIDVKGVVEEMVFLPVYVDNDVNMLTEAEIAYGVGREVSEFLTVTIGRGVGLGIVIRGEVYRGAFGGAAEFGHTKIDSDLRCECGSIGCLEAVVSEEGIRTQVATAQGLPALTIEDVIALASQGDGAVRAVFERAGRVLGHSIGNLVNLFNPQLVVVTGEGTRAGSLLLHPMREAIRDAAFSLLGDDTKIVVQGWGDEAWARGAASIVVHEMLKPPIYESGASGPLTHLLDRRTRSGATVK